MTNLKSTAPVVAEISDDGDRINVVFDYSPKRVKAIKDVPSHRFVPREKGGPYWRVNLELSICRRLREAFGDELGLGEKLKAWGHEEVAKERNLSELSQADDAELRLADEKLFNGNGFRPYQRADVKFMSTANVLNANQPGAGKTSEVIAAVIEQGMEKGQHLILAPIASLDTVWKREITTMYSDLGLKAPVVLTGDNPEQRREAIAEATKLAAKGKGFWLVLNPAMARMHRRMEGKGDNAKSVEELVHPELAEIEWTTMTVDEFHLMGLSNPATMGARGVNYIASATQPQRKYALSGTPMGGKPIKLWGALHFLDPEKFTSRWNWARTWLVVNHNGYGSQIEGIMPGREVDFYEHLKPYLVRRTKKEALPGLPPKQIIPVWCRMTPKQAEQYAVFAREAEWRIDDAEEEGRLSATNILAEYMRLKQFASAFCKVYRKANDEMEVTPTSDSGKLEQLMEKLAEEGVFDEDVKAPALIFSQFNGMVEMVAEALEAKGVKVGVISGKVTGKKRREIVEAFTAAGEDAPQVLVMNTKAGGTALNLSRADSVHMLDETWVPDDQEQAEDRAHRGDERTMAKDNVRIYYYRTQGSIEEYIQKLVADKAMNNKTILDLRRRMQQEAARLAKKEEVAA
jgi:SNF2 family DNA or RNA helicase